MLRQRSSILNPTLRRKQATTGGASASARRVRGLSAKARRVLQPLLAQTKLHLPFDKTLGALFCSSGEKFSLTKLECAYPPSEGGRGFFAALPNPRIVTVINAVIEVWFVETVRQCLLCADAGEALKLCAAGPQASPTRLFGETFLPNRNRNWGRNTNCSNNAACGRRAFLLARTAPSPDEVECLKLGQPLCEQRHQQLWAQARGS